MCMSSIMVNLVNYLHDYKNSKAAYMSNLLQADSLHHVQHSTDKI